jgi:hypothetical protein
MTLAAGTRLGRYEIVVVSGKRVNQELRQVEAVIAATITRVKALGLARVYRGSPERPQKIPLVPSS